MKNENFQSGLEHLYASYLESTLITDLKQCEENVGYEKNPPANPLLISIDEIEFRGAAIRIMFFGQETNTWNGKIQVKWSNNLNLYHQFFKNAMQGQYNGPFWIGIRSFRKKLRDEIKDISVEFVWNNIYKIGNQKHNTNRPTEEIRKIENNFFDVINKEIDILKPNVLLFFTGPNYDARVKKVFDDFKSEPLSTNIEQRKLARLNLANNILAYRTYHPGYLYRAKHLNEYIDLIIKDIAKHKDELHATIL